jgi:outer membrane protein TolC
VVDRVNDYYRLLQAADTIVNERASYERLILARERAEAMLEANRVSQNDVDQAQQSEISARNSWITAQTNYRLQLDSFKSTLGMPTEINIEPDRGELDKLQQAGLVELDLSLPEAEHLALEGRLDLKTSREEVEDRMRRLKIAENNLLPALDLSADLNVPEPPGNRYLDSIWEQRSYSAGVDLELPLDRKSERNSYRQALINVQSTERSARQLRNDIIVQVRRAYQNVLEARESYSIQQEGLRLAERRVDSVAMLLDAGEPGIDIFDQLDAENALRNARNAVTRALVDYTVARLDLFVATESLEIDEQGMWNETPIIVAQPE